MSKKLKSIVFLFILMIVWSVGISVLSGKSTWENPQKGFVPIVPQKTPMIGGARDILQFKAGEHVLGFRKSEMFVVSGDHALKVEFIRSRTVFPEEERFLNNPVTNGSTGRPLEKVTYRGLWDCVTLVYENHDSGVVKSTYTVEPSENESIDPVEVIRLRYNVPVKVAENGDLVLTFETGEMRESRPVAWQEIEGKRVSVEVSYCLTGEGEVGFKSGSYDPRYSLVIDPVLKWNTFMGSSGTDHGNAIAVDSSGNVYVAGYSYETWGTPVNAYAGELDVFVAKLNSSGVLQWNTFMGSSGTDHGNAIAVDLSGNVYVAGYCDQTWGTPINAYAGSSDAFVAKLNSNGVRQWNTFMGSLGTDYGNAIAVDSSGNVYVTGLSNMTWGSPLNAHVGYEDVFVAKLNSNGVRQWNTFMGSDLYDWGNAIAVDSLGNVYVSGTSFPVTWGTPVNAYAGGLDTFVAKLNSNGILLWNTFMGSSGDDYGNAIAVDSSGNVYVAGCSDQTWGTPVNAYAGELDAFVAKLNSSGVLQWNTFIGSSVIDCNAIAVDSSGNVYVAGESGAWGMPVNPCAGGTDAFVAKLNTTSGVLRWNTFMGSVTFDDGNAITVDSSGNIYVAGSSNANWGTPVNAYTGVSGYDAFVAKIYAAFTELNVKNDFNNDGREDILWRYYGEGANAGRNVVWYMNGKNFIGSDNIRSLTDVNWKIVGTGDFNGDGQTDILWQYDGIRTKVTVWYMNGKNFIGSDNIRSPADVNWKIVGTGDFNGDGKTDILWRYYGRGADAGRNVVWYMNGKNFIGSDNIRSLADVNWKIVGTGDFNRDEKTDILWQYDGGQTRVAVWYMNGKNFIGSDNIRSLADVNWKIVGTGDFNGDGKTDILLRYYGGGAGAGRNAILYLKRENYLNWNYIRTETDLNWKIVNH